MSCIVWVTLSCVICWMCMTCVNCFQFYWYYRQLWSKIIVVTHCIELLSEKKVMLHGTVKSFCRSWEVNIETQILNLYVDKFNADLTKFNVKLRRIFIVLAKKKRRLATWTWFNLTLSDCSQWIKSRYNSSKKRVSILFSVTRRSWTYDVSQYDAVSDLVVIPFPRRSEIGDR